MTMLNAKAMPVNFGFSLRDGQRAFYDNVNFNVSGNGVPVNKTFDLPSLGMTCVRTIFIDNVNGGDAVTFIVSGIGQTIKCQRGAQLFAPILQIGDTFGFIAFNFLGGVSGTGAGGAPIAGGGTVNFALLNFDVDPSMYSQSGQTIITTPLTVGLSDFSGSLAAAGISQAVLIGPDPSRRKIILQNPSTAAFQGIGAAESLFYTFGATGVNPVGSPSLELKPGDTYDSGMGPVPTAGLRVNAATIGHIFTCKAA